MVEHEILKKEWDKKFPARDKARNRALYLLGLAIYQIESAEVRAIREFKEGSALMLEKDLKQKLKEKLRDSKDDWITTLHREFKEEMIDNL